MIKEEATIKAMAYFKPVRVLILGNSTILVLSWHIEKASLQSTYMGMKDSPSLFDRLLVSVSLYQGVSLLV